jgi:hypothetical protein
MQMAKDFIEKKGKDPKTRISRLPELGEDTHFKSFFNGFYPCLSHDFASQKQMGGATATGAAEVEKLANQ